MSFAANCSRPSIFLTHRQLYCPPVSTLLSPHPFHRTVLTILQIWYVSYGPQEATDHMKRGWFELEVCWMCERHTGSQRQREKRISNISLNFLYWIIFHVWIPYALGPVISLKKNPLMQLSEQLWMIRICSQFEQMRTLNNFPLISQSMRGWISCFYSKFITLSTALWWFHHMRLFCDFKFIEN